MDLDDSTCLICNSSRNLKHLNRNYRNNSIIENYSVMIDDCFYFQWLFDETEQSKICGGCINRLKECLRFRSQVEKAYKNLSRRMYNSITSEICNDIYDVKIEDLEDHFADSADVNINPVLDSIKEEFNDIDFENNENNLDYSSDYSGSWDMKLSDLCNQKNINSDRWSVTSEEMDVATGRISLLTNKAPKFTIPPLDESSCICPICFEDFEDNYFLARHYYNHFPQFLCDICGMSYYRRNSYLTHIQKHSKTMFNCRLCPRTFKAGYSRWEHVQAQHKNKKRSRTCPKCGEGFTHNYMKQRHLHEKHGVRVKTYSCHICGRTFYQACKLREHERNVHIRQKNYFCKLCDQSFVKHNSLTRHMDIHSGVLKVQCDICGKTISNKQKLKRHLEMHYDIRRFKCHLCDKAFVQGTSLRCHLRGHVKNLV